jgi:hypothetical protein
MVFVAGGTILGPGVLDALPASPGKQSLHPDSRPRHRTRISRITRCGWSRPPASKEQ